MIANQVYVVSLTLIDEVDESGNVIDSAAYSGKAVSIINLLLLEITNALLIEPLKISSLTDELDLDDGAAIRALCYGLAAQFALADKDATLYNELYSEYRRAVNELTISPEPIEVSLYGLNGNAGRRL